jgi:integrase
MVGFFACMYYAALRPGEVLHLRQQDCTLPKLPETGWGELVLTGSTQYTGSLWGDNGNAMEDRALKHRASRSTRRVPVCPELVRILRHHLDAFTCGLDGRLFVTRTGAGRHPVAGGFAGPVSGSSYGGTWRKARAAALTTAEAASPWAPALRPQARLRLALAECGRAGDPGGRMGRAQRCRAVSCRAVTGIREMHCRSGGQRPPAGRHRTQNLATV